MVKRTKVDIAVSIPPTGQFTLLPCDVIDLTENGARFDIDRSQIGFKIPLISR